MSIFLCNFYRNNLSHLRLSNIHKSVTRMTLYEVLFHLASECCRDVYSPPTSKRRERMVVRTRSVILSQFSVAFVVFSWKSTGEVAGWRAKCKRIAQTAPDINAQSCTVGSLATSGATETVIYSELSMFPVRCRTCCSHGFNPFVSPIAACFFFIYANVYTSS